MFSKALFKQSCKANGTMWSIITFAVCFMLACVMLISGGGNIGEVKDSIQDTIIVKEVDAQLQKRAISYYGYANNGLKKFDEYFAENANDTLREIVWCSQMPSESDFADASAYAAAMDAWQKGAPEMKTETGRTYAETVNKWLASAPTQNEYGSLEEYISAVGKWQESSPVTSEAAVTAAYLAAIDSVKEWAEKYAADMGYTAQSTEANEILGSIMYTVNPSGMFNDFYTENGEDIPEDYDINSIITHISGGDIDAYLISSERTDYVAERASDGASIFLAGNMSKAESVEALMDALSSYGVTKEKYDSFGYNYSSIKKMAITATVTYTARLESELDDLADKYENGGFTSFDEYQTAVQEMHKTLANDISASFLSTLPSAVSDALEEIGQADLYTLIVGSIFYKLAGLLLPIIYMIMASNNLIAGQVDSGSMAYVLSTSTKREAVVFTQAVYLIGSLLAMFALTTATGCVCLSIIDEDVELTHGKLILLNVGAFLVLFALSGLCFFTSCLFDRSKRSMAIGGGLSIFALVAAMLGLFGSPVIPSVVRLDALNYFNYTTIISLFDVISIIDETSAFAFKFVILALIGIIGYIVGGTRFTKKDLPL